MTAHLYLFLLTYALRMHTIIQYIIKVIISFIIVIAFQSLFKFGLSSVVQTKIKYTNSNKNGKIMIRKKIM
jgi:hypothetical protein